MLVRKTGILCLKRSRVLFVGSGSGSGLHYVAELAAS